ncbi:MAG: hypothetical protein JST54_21090 [Deltaproteobacteria bacterium]|nr:hypothetical protein [Deltaproteobacteria bacterium]
MSRLAAIAALGLALQAQACSSPSSGSDADAGSVTTCPFANADCTCINDSDCSTTHFSADTSDAGECACLSYACGGEPINTTAVSKWDTHFINICADFRPEGFPDGGGCPLNPAVNCGSWVAFCTNGLCEAGPRRP